jgi:hypothetical protein
VQVFDRLLVTAEVGIGAAAPAQLSMILGQRDRIVRTNDPGSWSPRHGLPRVHPRRYDGDGPGHAIAGHEPFPGLLKVRSWQECLVRLVSCALGFPSHSRVVFAWAVTTFVSVLSWYGVQARPPAAVPDTLSKILARRHRRRRDRRGQGRLTEQQPGVLITRGKKRAPRAVLFM